MFKLRKNNSQYLDWNGIDTSSRKKKSGQGKTIRNNRQSASAAGRSSSHLNRAESSQSKNVETASNMIPCFPTSSDTDVHHFVIASNRFSPSHLTKDIHSNISQARTRSTTNNFITRDVNVMHVIVEDRVHV
jgi:hypothetical protein